MTLKKTLTENKPLCETYGTETVKELMEILSEIYAVDEGLSSTILQGILREDVYPGDLKHCEVYCIYTNPKMVDSVFIDLEVR